MNRKHTSTINLTVDIQSAGGVPETVTAQSIAATVQRAVALALSEARAGAGSTVEARVSSAFIVRTEEVDA